MDSFCGMECFNISYGTRKTANVNVIQLYVE